MLRASNLTPGQRQQIYVRELGNQSDSHRSSCLQKCLSIQTREFGGLEQKKLMLRQNQHCCCRRRCCCCCRDKCPLGTDKDQFIYVNLDKIWIYYLETKTLIPIKRRQVIYFIPPCLLFSVFIFIFLFSLLPPCHRTRSSAMHLLHLHLLSISGSKAW